jgi:hypothetical protein
LFKRLRGSNTVKQVVSLRISVIVITQIARS